MPHKETVPAGTQQQRSKEALDAFSRMLKAYQKGKLGAIVHDAMAVEVELRRGVLALGMLVTIRQYYINEVSEEAPFVAMIDKLIPREQAPGDDAPAPRGSDGTPGA